MLLVDSAGTARARQFRVIDLSDLGIWGLSSSPHPETSRREATTTSARLTNSYGLTYHKLTRLKMMSPRFKITHVP